MKQGTAEFEQRLAQGLAFEQGQAIDILHAHYPDHYIMNNKIDPSETTGGRVIGPRIYRGKHRDEEHIVPDFVMFDKSMAFPKWVDAKLKGASYPHRGREYFTIDRSKHSQYCKFPAFMLDNFYLLFKHEKTGACYMTKFRPDPDTIYFDNSYGKGNTPVYYLDTLGYLGGSSIEQ
jgi:hypothetical protein